MIPINIDMWDIDNRKIFLSREGDQHFLQSESTRVPLSFDQQGITLKYVQSCYPVFKNGTIFLARKLKEWALPDRIIRLLKSENSLLWQIFYKAMSKGFHFPIEVNQTQSVKEHAISLATLSSNQLPSFLLEKIIIQSELNKNVTIDSENWAITIVNCGKSFAGHAAIAIEGIDKIIPFFRYIHLGGTSPLDTTKGNIMNEGPTTHRFRHRGQTQTWLRSRTRVENLIQMADLEKRQQNGPMPIVYFNMLGPFIGTKPAKMLEFNSYEEFASFLFKRNNLGKDLFPHGIIYTQVKTSRPDMIENWIGETKSMFVRIHMKGPNEPKVGRGAVELFANPDNCLSYSVKKLHYASIEIDYKFGKAVPPTQFVDSYTTPENVEYAQERVIIPLWIEQTAQVVRMDFTNEIQRQLGNENWKLTSETVSQLDKWRWYPNLGSTGYTSLRKIRISAENIKTDLIICQDMREIFDSEKNTLLFGPLPLEKFTSLLSVEEIACRNPALILTVETKTEKKEINLSDECLKQFIELDMPDARAESIVDTLLPEVAVGEKGGCNVQ